MREGLKVLLIVFLLWPGGLFAQEIELDSTQLRDVLIPPVTADIDTAEAPATATYLYDRTVPMDADTIDDYDDASALLLRKVPAEVKDKFRKDKDLVYHQRPPKKPSDFRWLNAIVMGLMYFFKYSWWLIVLIILVAMGAAIFVYLRRNGYEFKRGKSAKVQEEVLLTEVEHDAGAYETQIQQAIAEGKLRLAVRLMYLQTIRILADKQIIEYSKEKTNAAYLRSLSQTPWHKLFARLTVDYEYIWYGEVPVSGDQFSTIQGQFKQFLNELGYIR
ncbi:DUF4129 domain-containing protein [Chitinophaga sancti]|uniref:DUF4129 domain-containing protein n=1 Tax=Chitinophaga sancti TaxID=1004 RepID=A0A1K1QB91_9BACT|nr:DUF4129 domain-containing protein [Chitinophaga sancti]WQD61338.1 DUF4129 domain-containing protein [Chitinophaga sancti]WQG93109.1 DUF4129 domain-containing protein [Chitinophaga sancti]SFW57218.1 protein of unknown function [Chitinophaga sancti]